MKKPVQNYQNPTQVIIGSKFKIVVEERKKAEALGLLLEHQHNCSGRRLSKLERYFSKVQEGERPGAFKINIPKNFIINNKHTTKQEPGKKTSRPAASIDLRHLKKSMLQNRQIDERTARQEPVRGRHKLTQSMVIHQHPKLDQSIRTLRATKDDTNISKPLFIRRNRVSPTADFLKNKIMKDKLRAMNETLADVLQSDFRRMKDDCLIGKPLVLDRPSDSAKEREEQSFRKRMEVKRRENEQLMKDFQKVIEARVEGASTYIRKQQLRRAMSSNNINEFD